MSPENINKTFLNSSKLLIISILLMAGIILITSNSAQASFVPISSQVVQPYLPQSSVAGPSSVLVTVNSVDLSLNPITGMWAIIRDLNGNTIAVGFTPMSSSVASGQTYVVHVGNFKQIIFNHWNDGTTSSYETVTPANNVVLTAYYATSTVSSISLNPTSGPSGTSVVILGTNFAPTSAIDIKFDGISQITNPVTITTSPTGSFTGSIIIPTSTGGAHIISATDATANSAQATFTITNLLHPTTTTITSNPSQVTAGNSIIYTTTVSDTSASPTAPGGIVSFNDGGKGGSFTTCTLTPGIGQSTCMTTYTPTTTGPITITGTYPTTAIHQTSFGISSLTVNPSSAGTIVMSDTATSFGSLISTPRQFIGEFASPTSVLVGKQIDSVTLSLSKAGAPIGIAQVGIFDINRNLVKSFGTIDVSTIIVPYQNYDFKLTSPDLYTIQSGDRIGFKYTGGDALNGINVMVDRSTTGAFDGANSYRVRYESAWITSPTEDVTMILKQTGISIPTPSILLNPTSGPIGNIVNISGTNFVPSSTISIKFDSTSQTTNPAIITSSPTGSFTTSITVPSSSLGSHSISATDTSANLVSTPFTVTPIPVPSIQLSPSSGLVGSTTHVSGNHFAPSSTISIKFDGTILTTSPLTITTDSTGSFASTTFLVPSSTVASHTVSATDASANVASSQFSTTSSSSISDTTLVTGLSQPTSMEIAPDGRIFIDQKAGSVIIIKNGVKLATPFLTIPVNSADERGLLGIAFDPNFASNGFVYIYHTETSPIHNVVSRFTASQTNPDVADMNSRVDLISLENLGPTNHNGGAIHFGLDGKLYVAVGNNAINSNSQTLTNHLGKILRINPDGTAPSDNPFFAQGGAAKDIWAYGLRNPFTFAFSPTGTMYINDVGENTWEEINQGTKGANYGWSICEGTCNTAGMTNPIYTYNHSVGQAITGGAFYQGNLLPAQYQGSYFFSDYLGGWIHRLDSNKQESSFLTANSPVDIKVSPDGTLYYISIGSGTLHKVT